MFPDYGFVVIGANTGITKLTGEHFRNITLSQNSNYNFITKIDMAPKHIYQKLCNRLKKLLTKSAFGKVLYFISNSENNDKDTNHFIQNMVDNHNVIPTISISNKRWYKCF